MSYNQDIFIDNCVMRLVQLAAAIRQNSDALASQELDRMEREFDAIADQREEEIDCQSFDATDNA